MNTCVPRTKGINVECSLLSQDQKVIFKDIPIKVGCLVVGSFCKVCFFLFKSFPAHRTKVQHKYIPDDWINAFLIFRKIDSIISSINIKLISMDKTACFSSPTYLFCKSCEFVGKTYLGLHLLVHISPKLNYLKEELDKETSKENYWDQSSRVHQQHHQIYLDRWGHRIHITDLDRFVQCDHGV